MTASTTRRLMLAAAAASALPAWAQTPGEKTIRFVLPNATGSGVDAITRAAQPALAKALGHPVVVDNQPGAGGVIGLQQLARSAPDGFTLSVVSNNVVIFPSVIKSLPFDMPGDFTPIAIVGSTPIVLVVNKNVPANNSKEFVALLKSQQTKNDIVRKNADAEKGYFVAARYLTQLLTAVCMQMQYPQDFQFDGDSEDEVAEMEVSLCQLVAGGL